MSQRLIILFDQQALDNGNWAILEESGQILQHDQGELPQGNERFQTMNIDVFLPSTALTLLPVSLPNMSSAQQRQALTYAVEEFIADDIDTVHIAYTQEQHHYFVAVISRQLLQHYLAVMAQKNLIANSLQSDVFLLPVSDDAWHIAATRNHVRVRQSRYLGFCADRKNASVLITRALESAEKKPSRIFIDNFVKNEFVLLHDGVEVEHQFVAGDLLNYYAPKNPLEAINLLQGEFRQTPPLEHNKKLFALTQKIVAVWLGIFFGTFLINTIFLHMAINRQNAQIASLYQEIFPQASSIVEPKLRLSRELADVSARTQGTVLQQLLQQVGISKSATNDLTITAISYRDQTLQLHCRAAKMESLQTFTHSLENAGLLVKATHAQTPEADITIKRNI